MRHRSLLVDALEKSLKRTSRENLCQRLYEGRLLNRTTCMVCGNKRDSPESFYDVLVQVLNCDDLPASLRAYIQPEHMSGDNKYFCEVCGQKQEAHRAVILDTLPPVLTFSCQRFDIDRNTWQRVKVNNKNVCVVCVWAGE